MLVGALLVGASAGAESLEERVERLERRIAELEGAAAEAAQPDPAVAPRRTDGRIPEWVHRFHLSGNLDTQYLHGEENSRAGNDQLTVDNARLFVDVDVSGPVSLFERPLFESSSFFLEWDLVRKSQLHNEIGSLYVRLDRLLGSESANLKLGRFPVPFGEEYLRFHEDRPSNPLISFSAASPYGWDEGVLLFGSSAEHRVQYMLAVTDGDYDVGESSASEPQITSKLIVEPTPWLHLSASGLRTGRVGPTDEHPFGVTSTMFGEFGAYPIIGPHYQDGVLVAADPSPELDNVYAWEVDAILRDSNLGRLWLSFGQLYIDSDGPSRYDRKLDYWVVEGVLELGAFSESLSRFYAAVRYSAIGTFDSSEGWRLRVMNEGANIFYNVERVDRVSAGLGVRLNPHVTLKTEYTRDDFDVVRGVPSSISDLARDKDYFGAGLSVGF
jgi:hypothetical protein